MAMVDYNGIGQAFIQQYFQMCDNAATKNNISNLYNECSLLTYEGDQKQGKQAIMERKNAVPLAKHHLTSIDIQPMLSNPDRQIAGILIMVIGQVITEGETRPIGFTQIFHLCNSGSSYYISNEVFRLNLHNG